MGPGNNNFDPTFYSFPKVLDLPGTLGAQMSDMETATRQNSEAHQQISASEIWSGLTPSPYETVTGSLLSFPDTSIGEFLNIHSNAIKALYEHAVYKRCEKRINLKNLIGELNELVKIFIPSSEPATQIEELSGKGLEENGNPAGEQNQHRLDWDKYQKIMSIMSMLGAVDYDEHTPEIIRHIAVLIHRMASAGRLTQLQQDAMELDQVLFILENAEASSGDNPIIWVQFPAENQTFQRLFFLPFSLICREGLLEVFNYFLSDEDEHDGVENEMDTYGLQRTFGALMFYTLISDVAIHGGIDKAEEIFGEHKEFFAKHWDSSDEDEDNNCIDEPYSFEFFRFNFIDKFNRITEEPFSLDVCGVKIIKFQLDDETKTVIGYFPMTTEDFKTRAAWIEQFRHHHKI
ncbi:hypothetical protein IWQ61_009084 [Dispira simplex]|nr:hypothetical protein IWQ61_009084 [Dispira simplex]